MGTTYRPHPKLCSVRVQLNGDQIRRCSPDQHHGVAVVYARSVVKMFVRVAYIAALRSMVPENSRTEGRNLAFKVLHIRI